MISDVEVEKTLLKNGMANVCQLFTSNDIGGVRVASVLYEKGTKLFVVGILRFFSNEHGVFLPKQLEEQCARDSFVGNGDNGGK
ncbi:unnamed protein product [Cylicocyclus nassatus]|uniref:Uncharacterized protein n=1 Tax=Cylicocyclus nassatus TaxID=53992 RepID=A0AA36DNK4_CYLNA|nr:unnamed protein product [Cylicocyclus nassatus]